MLKIGCWIVKNLPSVDELEELKVMERGLLKRIAVRGSHPFD
jgi:hypothetical protein